MLSRLADACVWLADGAQWKDADQAEAGALVRKFKPADMNRPGERDAGIGWMDEPDYLLGAAADPGCAGEARAWRR